MSGAYTMPNGSEAAAVRMGVLADLYDRVSAGSLSEVPVAGRRCWDVGTGGGTIAHHLHLRGADEVVATDIDLSHLSLRAAARVTAFPHDVVNDAIPTGGFDVIHVRLVLSHLPEWHAMMWKLIGALRPGGWLVVGELDPMTDYQPAPVSRDDHLVNVVGRAFTDVLASRGGNPRLGRSLRRLMIKAGLVDTTSAGHVVEARGGEPAADLMIANVEQTADLLRMQGVTAEMITAFIEALNRPSTHFVMPTFWTARGRKP